MMEGLLSLDTGPNSEVGNEEIVNAAAYNLYLAYLHGWGVKQSDEKALEFLMKAAGRGATKIAVLAQTTLGYYFSSPDHLDLAKAFYWHNEACGYGGVESQAVLGLMYMYGLHVKADWCAALKCLKEAAERGSVYGKGVLSLLYFQRKMYSMAAQTACSLAMDADLKAKIMRKLHQIFPRRGVAIACFVYACCLERGLGVQKDQAIARAMHARKLEGLLPLERCETKAQFGGSMPREVYPFL
ncbi:unnamed protein product [Schistocephalus solidus]|uniref:LRP2-binding protein n=1 Tax=Schistocephalus solidus TaxID=70667 RepID=A0A183T069_SCHSO|nr:unnamed protein product [Schistocephalus solidus]